MKTVTFENGVLTEVPNTLFQGCTNLETVVLSENIFDEFRYLSGTDEKKIEEMHKFFSNPDIDAIICMRGGYGAVRLIKKLDYDLIKNNPKIFCGYSDISA